MRKINDFDKVQENGGGFKRIPDGGYIVGVKKVEDLPDKESLRLELDVCKGEYKNWFQQRYDEDKREPKYWPREATLWRSYKENALPFFKGFITSITKSNPKFEWKWNEQDLKNKVFGVVVGTEQYLKNNGGVGTRPYIASVHSVETIEKGDFTIPELKALDVTKATKSGGGIKSKGDDIDFGAMFVQADNTSKAQTDTSNSTNMFSDDDIWGEKSPFGN